MTKVIKSVVPALILLSIFLYALIPINDFDFWWHLKTGEYILENRQLPDTDPFSYTAVSIDRDSPGRPQLILKSYWLGQVVFALVVKYLGLKGFIIMRGLVFALIGLTAFSVQRVASSEKSSTTPYTLYALRCMLLFLLALITTECLTDRPQMFSFLFAILLVFLFESYRSHATRYTLYAIPFLMLLWPQIHAGYIVGMAYLLVYLVTLPFEGPREAGSGQRVGGREGETTRYTPNAIRYTVYAVIIISILVTYLNPTRWQGIGAVFYAHGGSMLHRETLEFLSPVTVLPFTTKNPGWLAYWTLIGLSLVAIVPLIKRRSWSRLLILTGAAAASLVSMRYTYFFAPLAAALIPSAFSSYKLPVQSDTLEKLPATRYTLHAFFMLLVLAFTVGFTYHRVSFKGLLKSEIAGGYFPVQASEYILSSSIPQPVFNDINWGGYLMHRLWPEYKVFADTRTLNVDIYRQYMNVLNFTRQGRDILKVYSIKSIITPAINPYTGEIFPLVRGLMRDDDWALVYLDGIAMIFVRKEYADQALPKTVIYKQVFYEVMFWAPSFPDVPGYRKTMEEVQANLATNLR